MRLAKNLSKKPLGPKPNAVNSNPFVSPFEDGLCVGDLDEKHRLLLNKFNVVDHHVLIVTREFVSQESELRPNLFAAVLRCLHALRGFAFFNHGFMSGAR